MVAVFSTLLADLGAISPLPAVALLIGACVLLLVALILRPALSADKRLRIEVAAWKEALVHDRSTQLSHDLVHWPRRVMRDTASLLRTSGLLQEAAVVDRASERCEAAAVGSGTEPHTRDFGDPSGGQRGLVGGAALTAPTRSDQPLRHFSVSTNLPKQLGSVWVERLSRLLRSVDLVRLLHTPQIERLSLVGMLWLRAAVILAAPLTGSISLTGDVPLGPDSSGLAEAVYWLVAVEALGAAILAPRIADHVIGRPVRWRLLAGEQALGLALLAAFPCWACCAYAAGPIVWFEKREWHLWKIPIWAAVNLGAVVVFASQSPISDRLGEAAIGALVVALIADSYGLMLPAVLATLLRSWREEKTARKLVVTRAAKSRSTVRSAIIETRVVLRRVGKEAGSELDQEEIDDLLDGLASAEERLKNSALDDDPRRQPRTLSGVCAQAIARAGVSPVGWDPGADLHATQIDCRPEDLGRLELAGSASGRALERLIKRAVFEAVAHGLGLLSTRIELLDDRVVLAIANEVHPNRIGATSTGHGWTETLAASLPDAIVDPGRIEDFNGLRMWVVRIQLGAACFRTKR